MTLTRTKAVTYSCQIIVSFSKINSVLSAKSNLSGRTMAYNTSATLDKQHCTDYMDFGKTEDRFGQTSSTKNDSNYLDIESKVFKRKSKDAEFRLRQNFTKGEADFNKFVRQRNELVVTADNSLREQSLSPVLQSTLSKDMEQQLKLVHKVDCLNRRICVTLLL